MSKAAGNSSEAKRRSVVERTSARMNAKLQRLVNELRSKADFYLRSAKAIAECNGKR